MIVYGDPHDRETLGSLLDRVRTCVNLLVSDRMTCQFDLDRLRSLLVLCGQMEQAAEDGFSGEHDLELATIRVVTDLAATVFRAGWSARGGSQPGRGLILPSLERLARLLDHTFERATREVTVKIPEGFAFYALYPDAYCAAAQRWLDDHAACPSRRALVVGVRSIGTTLSAVVAATLAAAGWRADRATVRPTGHPFNRHTALATELATSIERDEWGLVVDEGPGLSGSSMASVADALVEAGVAPERICFFPGHAGDPGRSASAGASAWWHAAPRYVTRHEDVRLGGASIVEALAEATRRFVGSPNAFVQVEDFGGGAWRSAASGDPAAWPAVCAAFERAKYRCSTQGGERLLFKFGGLAWTSDPSRGVLVPAADTLAMRLDALAEAGWSPPTLGVAHGFVATRWIDGTPMRSSDADPGLLALLGRYLADSAGTELSSSEDEQALERARTMVRWNATELLGDEATASAERWVGFAPKRALPPLAYGDGRLAPHEWIRADDGRIWKTDAAGHDRDHTAVGRQPLVWDVAGALVEWECDDAAAATLLQAFRDAGGSMSSEPTLRFYRLAYAAFRAGQCRLCADGAADDVGERARLERAYARYRSEMARWLARPPV